jgi:ABC-type polar amino acid transport system ATPase subunit
MTNPAVRGVSLGVEQGHILCLLGPFRLRQDPPCCAWWPGWRHRITGRVLFAGQDLTQAPPQKRNFGLMFQEFALFPHQSVYRQRGLWPGDAKSLRPGGAEQSGLELMSWSMMGIADLASAQCGKALRRRAPKGGPGPFSGPGAPSAHAGRAPGLPGPRPAGAAFAWRSAGILKKLNTTAIFVTHDQSEALAIADQVAVMNAGTPGADRSARGPLSEPGQPLCGRFSWASSNFVSGRGDPG